MKNIARAFSNTGRHTLMGVLGWTLLSSLGASPAFADSDSQNEAQFLWLENCGAYIIKDVKVQRRENEGGGWVDTGYSWDGRLHRQETLCFDIGEMSESRHTGGGIPNGYQVRLKVSIRSGDTKTCDSTWVSRDDSVGTRIFKMKGTTTRNNDCNSKGYKNSMRNTSLCSANGRSSARSTTTC